jgi:hypothetical protein
MTTTADDFHLNRLHDWRAAPARPALDLGRPAAAGTPNRNRRQARRVHAPSRRPSSISACTTPRRTVSGLTRPACRRPRPPRSPRGPPGGAPAPGARALPRIDLRRHVSLAPRRRRGGRKLGAPKRVSCQSKQTADGRTGPLSQRWYSSQSTLTAPPIETTSRGVEKGADMADTRECRRPVLARD